MTSGRGLEGHADSLPGELGPRAERHPSKHRHTQMLGDCVLRVLGRPPREADREMRFEAMVYLGGDGNTPGRERAAETSM